MMQTGLQDMGIDCGVPDGDFGTQTERGVNDLRESVGLPTDGVVDADVWQIIFQ
jgi:peptidoglycan hydrolase-like protein with peptidoglycan-binding domain